MVQSNINWLCEFYESLCDDYWEHLYGFSITNIDNPGWKIDFDLAETRYESFLINYTLLERSEHDWVAYRKEGSKFEGYCGPKNLDELLGIFRSWVESGVGKL